MTRSVAGMHVPNARPWYVGEMAQAIGPMGCATILHCTMLDDQMIQQWGDIENRRWYLKLRQGFQDGSVSVPPAPEMFLHVRMYHPNWRTVDPVIWAEHSVELLAHWSFDGVSANLWDDPFVGVSPANEQNIEGWVITNLPYHERPAAYAKVAQWNMAFWKRVDQLVPNRRALSVWSALAQGHDVYPNNPDSEYTVPEIRDAIAYCDVGASHPYGHLTDFPDGRDLPGGADEYWGMLRDFRPVGWRDEHQPGVGPHDPGGTLAQFPGKPWLFSEVGTFGHSNPALAMKNLAALKEFYTRCADSGRVIGATPFIWNSDQSHPTNAIVPSEGLRQGLARLGPVWSRGVTIPQARAGRPSPVPGDTPPGMGGTGIEVITRVRSGEGWFAVARRLYGDTDVRGNADRLAAANGLTVRTAVRSGQILQIPQADVKRLVCGR